MFYVIEIATGDSRIAGKAVYEYPSQIKAEASFHKKVGAAMDSDLYDTHTALVIDINGAVYASHFYTKPVEEPAPAEE